MQVTFKGKVQSVGAVRTEGEKNTRVQSLLIFVPGFSDEFGDKKGKDQIFPVDVLGDTIEKFPFTGREGSKVNITAYLNSNQAGEKFFLSLRLKSAEFVS